MTRGYTPRGHICFRIRGSPPVSSRRQWGRARPVRGRAGGGRRRRRRGLPFCRGRRTARDGWQTHGGRRARTRCIQAGLAEELPGRGGEGRDLLDETTTDGDYYCSCKDRQARWTQESEDVSSENLVGFKDIRVAEWKREQRLETRLTTGIVEHGRCRERFQAKREVAAVGFAPMRKLLFGGGAHTTDRAAQGGRRVRKSRALSGQDSEAGEKKKKVRTKETRTTGGSRKRTVWEGRAARTDDNNNNNDNASTE